MIYIQLFYTFFKIGLLGFGGGYGMLSLIQFEIVEHYHWLTVSPIMLHFGTLVSLVIVYFKDIVKLAVEFILSIRDLIQKKSLNICKNETRKLSH